MCDALTRSIHNLDEFFPVAFCVHIFAIIAPMTLTSLLKKSGSRKAAGHGPFSRSATLGMPFDVDPSRVWVERVKHFAEGAVAGPRPSTPAGGPAEHRA